MTTATLSRPFPPTRTSAPGPATPAVASADALRLLTSARASLAEAVASADPLERYAAAHLAALRAAAALLADRTRPVGKRARRPTSAWTLLVAVAPELAPWAGYFAAGADKRIAAEAGVRGTVTTRAADDLVRDAEAFLALVETSLGLLALPIG